MKNNSKFKRIIAGFLCAVLSLGALPMRELSAIGNNINQLSVKANTLGFVDAPMLKREAQRWHKFQADIERVFLRPEKSEMKWQ